MILRGVEKRRERGRRERERGLTMNEHHVQVDPQMSSVGKTKHI